MPNNSLVFTNARVKTLENTLLSSEKLTRLSNCENIEDGMKILIESGYGGGITAETNDFEALLQAEDKKLCDFLKEAMPKNSGLESFLIKNDYHNAKAIVKAKYTKIVDIDFMLCPQGNIEVEILKEKIFADNYSSFSPFLSKALTTIDNARANGDKSPRMIDCVLDIAMYAEILKLVKASKVASVIKYWMANIDLANISNFVRCKDINAEVDFFEQNLIDGGTLSKAYFQDAYSQSLTEFVEKLRYSDYASVCLESLTQKNMTLFEKNWDNFCQQIFSKDKNDIFSVAPIAGFFVAKKIEIKVVRMVMILLKAKVDKALIKQRLRDFYA
ncbi:MAG: V-type ATPase subunit [Clostridia bacterium]